MGIFDNKLARLMNYRMSWLNKRTEVIATNIAEADLKGRKRVELRSFQEIMKQRLPYLSSNRNSFLPREMHFNDEDITETRLEISRDLESLEMARNTSEHEAVVNVFRTYQKMFRNILSRSGG